MTSLNIQQSTQSSETVSSAVIEKLYNLAINSKVEDKNNSLTMTLQGNISVPAAFEDSVLYLRSKFPNLTINIPENKYYIRFKDPVLRDFCKNTYGDGIGVTKSEAAGVNTYTTFWGRNAMDSETKATVTSLEDFQYFTGASGMDSTVISQFPNVTEIKFPSIVFSYNGIYDYRILENSYNVSTIDYGNATFISSGNVGNNGVNVGTIYPIYFNRTITDFSYSLIPNQTDFYCVRLFHGWTVLQKIIFPEGVTRTSDLFRSMTALQYVEYPTTITDIGIWAGMGQDKGNRNYVIVIKSTTPPTMYYYPNDNANNQGGWYWHNFPTYIYVPDSAVDTYKNVTPLTIGSETRARQLGWVDQQIKDLIKPLSELPQIYLEMGTVTQEDIDRV